MNTRTTLILVALTIALIVLFCPAPVRAAESEEMKEGMKCFYEKNFDKAKESFHSVYKKEPDNSLALLYLLDCYAQSKNLQPILNELEEAALEKPNDALLKAHLGLGYFAMSLLKRDVSDEALNAFQDALKMDNNLAMGYLGMGIVYYNKRMIPRSRSYFSKAVKINPDDVVALEKLGEIFMVDDKNYGAAQNLFSHIIELYPSYPDGYFYFASASQKLGEFDKAVENYEKTMALDPLGLTRGYYAPQRLGDIYYENLKNNQKATEYYEKSLKISPENSYSKRMLQLIKNPPKEEDKKGEPKPLDQQDDQPKKKGKK
jgi:tetratricopeptide (TPR) repeat protein